MMTLKNNNSNNNNNNNNNNPLLKAVYVLSKYRNNTDALSKHRSGVVIAMPLYSVGLKKEMCVVLCDALTLTRCITIHLNTCRLTLSNTVFPI